MNKIYDYTSLSLTELIEKISTARFFHLPKMVAEAFKRLIPESPKYKVYTALLSQSGTDAPTAVVLENTLGDIVWSRSEEGVYVGTLTGAFKEGKTFQALTAGNANGSTSFFYRQDIDTMLLETYAISGDSASDTFLNRTSIEIRVYN